LFAMTSPLPPAKAVYPTRVQTVSAYGPHQPTTSPTEGGAFARWSKRRVRIESLPSCRSRSITARTCGNFSPLSISNNLPLRKERLLLPVLRLPRGRHSSTGRRLTSSRHNRSAGAPLLGGTARGRQHHRVPSPRPVPRAPASFTITSGHRRDRRIACTVSSHGSSRIDRRKIGDVNRN
jgi:hypothetical protein